MAEWLRRLTRNQFPSGSVGSNPTNCEFKHFCYNRLHHNALTSTQLHQFLDSLVVRISACHVEGPGSIPGRGVTLFTKIINSAHLFLLNAPLYVVTARLAQSVER